MYLLNKKLPFKLKGSLKIKTLEESNSFLLLFFNDKNKKKGFTSI